MKNDESLVDIRQRIVGAVVIVSLAIIFLPMILTHEPARKSQSKNVHIPDIPKELRYSSTSLNRRIPSPPAMPEISEPKVFPVDEINAPLYASAAKNKKENTQPSITNKIAKSNTAKTKAKSEQIKSSVKPTSTKAVSSKSTKDNNNRKKAVAVTRIKKAKPSIEKEKVKRVNKSPYKDSFVIQLGSFGQLVNAQNLTYKLRKKKFSSYLEMIKISGGKHYRVRVGPYSHRKDAEKIQARIKYQFKISGRVMTND